MWFFCWNVNPATHGPLQISTAHETGGSWKNCLLVTVLLANYLYYLYTPLIVRRCQYQHVCFSLLLVALTHFAAIASWATCSCLSALPGRWSSHTRRSSWDRRTSGSHMEKKQRWETRDNEQKSHECEERSNLDNLTYTILVNILQYLTGSGDIWIHMKHTHPYSSHLIPSHNLGSWQLSLVPPIFPHHAAPTKSPQLGLDEAGFWGPKMIPKDPPSQLPCC